MSGADDQRLAPTETQRLRNQIDDLTRERDLYKRMLERYEPDPTYSTPTELDRLRAELAETRAAWLSPAEVQQTLGKLPSVRGDAPTQPPAADLSWPVDGPDPINTLRNLPGAHPHIDIVEARLHALLPPALEAGCPDCGSDDCDDYDWATRARHEAAVVAMFEEYGYREGASLARLAVIAIEGVSVPQKPAESTDGELTRLRYENNLMRDAEYTRSERYRFRGDAVIAALHAQLVGVGFGPDLDRAVHAWETGR